MGPRAPASSPTVSTVFEPKAGPAGMSREEYMNQRAAATVHLGPEKKKTPWGREYILIEIDSWPNDHRANAVAQDLLARRIPGVRVIYTDEAFIKKRINDEIPVP
jgi:hypothetical protein